MRKWETPSIQEMEISDTQSETWQGGCWDGAYLGDGKLNLRGYWTNNPDNCKDPNHNHKTEPDTDIRS